MKQLRLAVLGFVALPLLAFGQIVDRRSTPAPEPDNPNVRAPTEVVVQPPVEVRRAWGKSEDPPGPGNRILVRKNFIPELERSVGAPER